MVHLTLVRDKFTPITSIGRLYINDEYFCETLEDRTRPPGVKIYGETAIPLGTYKITLFMSPKRGYLVPLLHNVPMFSWIEIHIGNSCADTMGCILVGEKRGTDRIYNSTNAFRRLMKILQAEDEISITIKADEESLAEAGLAA